MGRKSGPKQTPDGRWFLQYRVEGRKSAIKEYFGRGPEAEIIAWDRFFDIQKDRKRKKQISSPRDGVYLDTLAQLYMDDAKLRGVSENWQKEMKRLLNAIILPSLTHKPVERLDYSDVMSMVKKYWSHLSPRSIGRYLGYLRSVFKFGQRHGLVNTHPLMQWKKKKYGKKVNFTLSIEDLQRIIDSAAPHVSWAAEIIFMTGARPGPSELFKLRWSDVDFNGMTIHIRGTKTLTSDRLVFITQDDVDRLKMAQRLSQSPYIISYKNHPIKSQITHGWKSALKKAEIIYECVPYDIRHLYATEMLRAGADLAAVSALMGHATVKTTADMYYHLMEGERERAATLRPQIRPTKGTGKVLNFDDNSHANKRLFKC